MRKLPNCPVLLKMREYESERMRQLIDAGVIGAIVTGADAAIALGVSVKRAVMALEACGYVQRRSARGRWYSRSDPTE
jgi:hypothetical protein